MMSDFVLFDECLLGVLMLIDERLLSNLGVLDERLMSVLVLLDERLLSVLVLLDERLVSVSCCKISVYRVFKFVLLTEPLQSVLVLSISSVFCCCETSVY